MPESIKLDVGGERLYTTDFKIYDERAAGNQNIVMNFFVGIQTESGN